MEFDVVLFISQIILQLKSMFLRFYFIGDAGTENVNVLFITVLFMPQTTAFVVLINKNLNISNGVGLRGHLVWYRSLGAELIAVKDSGNINKIRY
jgi:hypothetical protein